MDGLVPVAIVAMLVLGLPWLILHYVTVWKRSRGLSAEDERVIEELYDLARRLEERMDTIERVIESGTAADLLPEQKRSGPDRASDPSKLRSLP